MTLISHKDRVMVRTNGGDIVTRSNMTMKVQASKGVSIDDNDLRMSV
jgi:hypothetical protein